MIPNWKEDEKTALYDVANTTPNYNPLNPNHNYTPITTLNGCLYLYLEKYSNGYHSITIALPKNTHY